MNSRREEKEKGERGKLERPWGIGPKTKKGVGGYCLIAPSWLALACGTRG